MTVYLNYLRSFLPYPYIDDQQEPEAEVELRGIIIDSLSDLYIISH